MKTVELRAVWKLDNGSEQVQTGIYVFENTTIKEMRELMESYKSRGEKVPDYVEFNVVDKEED